TICERELQCISMVCEVRKFLAAFQAFKNSDSSVANDEFKHSGARSIRHDTRFRGLRMVVDIVDHFTEGADELVGDLFRETRIDRSLLCGHAKRHPRRLIAWRNAGRSEEPKGLIIETGPMGMATKDGIEKSFHSLQRY